jgi:amino acid transporter
LADVPSAGAFSGAVLLLIFAFTGFENAVIPAGEAADPRRHLPFALLTGAVLTTVLYLGIQAVCIGILPALASSNAPLADVADRLVGSAGAAVVALGALISVSGTMSAIMLSAPRLLFAMAEQRQLPAPIAVTHPRFRTPHVAIVVSALGMLGFSLWGTFASAATLSAVIRLLTYAVTCAALPLLRRRHGTKGALFVIPAGRAVSVAALVLIGWLFVSSPRPDLAAALAACIGGGVLYVAFARGRRAWRSRDDRNDEGTTT